jgi:hypothetical protein
MLPATSVDRRIGQLLSEGHDLVGIEEHHLGGRLLRSLRTLNWIDLDRAGSSGQLEYEPEYVPNIAHCAGTGGGELRHQRYDCRMVDAVDGSVVEAGEEMATED